MKNLTLALMMLISIAAKSQTKVITNADGTSTTVTRNNNTIIVSNSTGQQFTVVNNGFSSVIMDGGGHLQFSRHGGTTTMAGSNGKIYTWVDISKAVKLVDVNGNYSTYERIMDPFVLSIMERKFYVTFSKNSYTLEHLDGSHLITSVSGDKVTTDVTADVEQAPAQAPVQTQIAGIKSKMLNADGTYTTIIKNGDTYHVKTEYTVTMARNKSTITNPDGTVFETTVKDDMPPVSKKAGASQANK